MVHGGVKEGKAGGGGHVLNPPQVQGRRRRGRLPFQEGEEAAFLRTAKGGVAHGHAITPPTPYAMAEAIVHVFRRPIFIPALPRGIGLSVRVG